LSLYAVFCLAISVFGSSFQVGWHIGVYNAPVTTIQHFFNQTYNNRYGEYMKDETWTTLWSLTNALNPAGGIIGGLASGFVVDYFGRRKALLFANIFTFISGILAVISKPIKSYESLIIGRFFAGIQSGLFLGIIPLYLSEIPSKKLRGITGCLNQLLLATGILVSNVLGIPQTLGTDKLWPYLVGLTFVPMIIHLVFLPFCSETPKFLYIYRNEPEAARKALQRLRGVGYEIEDELSEIKLEMEAQSKTFSYLDFIKNKTLFRALIITMGINF
jgi:MFS transporter, SP family, solute carrier family 2 (facilitated glucose transporter), member 1